MKRSSITGKREGALFQIRNLFNGVVRSVRENQTHRSFSCFHKSVHVSYTYVLLQAWLPNVLEPTRLTRNELCTCTTAVLPYCGTPRARGRAVKIFI